MTLDSELMALLACPKCKGALEPRPASPQDLVCNNCKLVFVSSGGILNFLVEEAKPLTH